ncbi:GPI ethanolamine phosphate transferase 2 [Ditylenchus destructor]|nr:GPI ethanolamine phosphate transferase 2 [Ditylenchus destructor]
MTKFAWIASAILLQLIAILLFGRGFLPQKPKRIVLEEVNETSKAEICPTEKPSSVKNLVIMVVDAFRDEFLFKSTIMRRTRQLIQSGEAKAFRSHVQSPTVTTPRIKALLSGTVPLFSELLLNFASNEYTEDNWLKRAKEDNKRILFYGDEVWMKMLPKGVFEARSEGVDSFYVKDYTDVDNNVTRYLDREFTPSGINSWDILILHYLGLDHVGHSLGGEHPQIDLKLDEMDEIIFNISHSLNRYRASDEFAFFVLGDHGMSLEGNHGGNSDMETHVPVIVIKPEMGSSIPEVVPAALIEQIDLVPVWCALSNTRTMPFDNLGVSFLPVIESDLAVATSGVIQNVKQYIAYLKGYHFESDVKPNLDMLNNCLQTLHESCSINQSSTREKSVKQTLSKCHTLMKITQDEILGPLSNYLHTFLLAGIAVSFIGILMLFIATFERRKLPTKCFWLILAQPFLMFASSFTEEEHDIWYFQLPLIICNLLWNHLNSMDTKSGSTKKSSATSRKNFLNSMLHGSGRWLITILVLHRIAQNTFSPQRRRWLLFPTEKTFDTGFEFSSMINFTHIASHQLLWNTINVFVALATIGTLCFHSVLTSVRYGTKPSQWPACLGFLCILLIKTLNCPISSELLGRVVQISVIWLFISLNFSLAFALWLLYVAKLELYYLFVISWIIGYAFGQISQDLNSLESSFLLHCTTSAAFFYTGNSNSIASIDISVGYAGLSSYQPVLIGLQIVLNAYAGPICVFLGW